MSKNKLKLLPDSQEEINKAEISKKMRPYPEKNSYEETSLLSGQEFKNDINSEKADEKYISSEQRYFGLLEKTEEEMEKDISTNTYSHVEIF